MSDPGREGRKEALQISKDSQIIKKPPLPLKTGPVPIVRYKYEVEPKIINVKSPLDFTYIVQLLTGDPNRPSPKYSCTCHERPQRRLLSPPPNHFTPPPPLPLFSVVNPPALPPPSAPKFKVPPSPFLTLKSEIPPSFNTLQFYPPNHFPPNN